MARDDDLPEAPRGSSKPREAPSSPAEPGEPEPKKPRARKRQPSKPQAKKPRSKKPRSKKPRSERRQSGKAQSKKPRSQKVGRPATGIQDLTRLSTFFTQEGRALLDAASWARHEPIYRLLERLVREHVDGMEPDERQRIEEAAAVLLQRRQPGGDGDDDEG